MSKRRTAPAFVAYHFFGPDEAGWVSVRGDQLEQPVRVRFGRSGRRLHIVGLEIDNNQELTSRLLRSIKFPEILDLYFEDWDPEDDLTSSFDAPDWWHEVVDQLAAVHVQEIPGSGGRPARRGQPPAEAQLRKFAQIYQDERIRHPSKAMEMTTRRMPMARSTAYRWAELCRDPQRAYLPPEEES
jgi:hypothetical protein